MPLGIIIPTVFLLFLWRHVPQGTVVPFPVFLDLFFLVPTLAIIVCLGAIAGFVYVKIRKKLPLSSIYAQAIVLSFCVWVVLLVISVIVPRPSLYILFRFFKYYLIVLALFGFDAMVFGYLLKRWTTVKRG